MTYLSERTCFIRANVTDRSKSLDSLERFTKNLVLSHQVRGDGQ